MEGVDYSAARPSGLCMYQAGKRFAVRYFGPGGSWKHATRAECAGLWASGVDLVAVAEGAVHDPLQGYWTGKAHAQAAHDAAVAAGMPAGRPIYFAVDFDQRSSDDYLVSEYLKGCRHVIGHNRVGVYGGFRTIKWAIDGGHATWFWQTYAWSYGVWHVGRHLEQYRNGVTVCGGTVDLCRSNKPDFGQWHWQAQSTGGAPAPTSPSTAETPWEFTDLIGALVGQVRDATSELDGATRFLRSL